MSRISRVFTKVGGVWVPWHRHDYIPIVTNTVLSFVPGTVLEVVAIGGGAGGSYNNANRPGGNTSFGNQLTALGGVQQGNRAGGGMVVGATTTYAESGGPDTVGDSYWNSGGGGGWGGGGAGIPGARALSGYEGGLGRKVSTDAGNGGNGFVVTSDTKGRLITLYDANPIQIVIGHGASGHGNTGGNTIDGLGGLCHNGKDSCGSGGAGALLYRVISGGVK